MFSWVHNYPGGNETSLRQPSANKLHTTLLRSHEQTGAEVLSDSGSMATPTPLVTQQKVTRSSPVICMFFNDRKWFILDVATVPEAPTIAKRRCGR